MRRGRTARRTPPPCRDDARRVWSASAPHLHPPPPSDGLTVVIASPDDDSNSNEVGTEHLLLGVLQEPDNAKGALGKADVDLGRTREMVAALVGQSDAAEKKKGGGLFDMLSREEEPLPFTGASKVGFNERAASRSSRSVPRPLKWVVGRIGACRGGRRGMRGRDHAPPPPPPPPHSPEVVMCTRRRPAM